MLSNASSTNQHSFDVQRAADVSSNLNGSNKDSLEASSDTDEDIVMYHPGANDRIRRQPRGPPPNLTAAHPNNFVLFQRKSAISDVSATLVAALSLSAKSSTSVTEPVRLSKNAGPRYDGTELNANLQKHAASLNSWRTKANSSVVAATHPSTPVLNLQDHTSMPNESVLSTVPTRTRSRSPFRKSLMWQSKHGLISSRRPGTNYQGDLSSKSGQATERGLDDSINCTLWLEGLPKDVTYPAMFDWLEEMRIGRVWALDIKPPQGNFPTSAARLTFYKQSSAQKLYKDAMHPNALCLQDQKVKVLFNRSGNRERDGYETRVIQIQGPAEMMSWEFWSDYFEDGIVYDLDRWSDLPCKVEGRAEMEIRFARVDGQAQTCIQKIYKDRSMDGIVNARYGKDPCE